MAEVGYSYGGEMLVKEECVNVVSDLAGESEEQGWSDGVVG